MAAITNVQLTITENQGFAAASVTYTLQGSIQDVQLHQPYSEVVELIGVDPAPLEDGQDDPLPVNKFQGALIFANTAPVARNQLFAMPSAALNEDPSPTIFGRDEIKARVTLTPIGRPIRRDSNIVVRGGLIVDNASELTATPA